MDQSWIVILIISLAGLTLAELIEGSTSAEKNNDSSTEATPCKNNPCLNNGTCSSNGMDSYSCRCSDAFEGQNCECISNICQTSYSKCGNATGVMCSPGCTTTTCSCYFKYDRYNDQNKTCEGILKSTIVDSVHFLNTTVQQGGIATLQCRMTSNSNPGYLDSVLAKKIEAEEEYANQTVLMWGNEKFRPLNPGDLVRQEDGSYAQQLTIKNVEDEDSGLYLCFVMLVDLVDDTVSFIFKEAYLIVTPSVVTTATPALAQSTSTTTKTKTPVPTMTTTPTTTKVPRILKSITEDSVHFLNRTVQQGAIATLQCRLTSDVQDVLHFSLFKKFDAKKKLLYANGQIFWRNEEFRVLKSIMQDGVLRQEDGSLVITLNITNVLDEDSGLYICVGIGNMGKETFVVKEAYLIVTPSADELTTSSTTIATTSESTSTSTSTITTTTPTTTSPTTTTTPTTTSPTTTTTPTTTTSSTTTSPTTTSSTTTISTTTTPTTTIASTTTSPTTATPTTTSSTRTTATTTTASSTTSTTTMTPTTTSVTTTTTTSPTTTTPTTTSSTTTTPTTTTTTPTTTSATTMTSSTTTTPTTTISSTTTSSTTTSSATTTTPTATSTTLTTPTTTRLTTTAPEVVILPVITTSEVVTTAAPSPAHSTSTSTTKPTTTTVASMTTTPTTTNMPRKTINIFCLLSGSCLNIL